MDDLLLIKDKKEIEDYLHPENIIDLFVRWNYLDKTNKQKLISKYIDDIEIEKLGTKIEIKKGIKQAETGKEYVGKCRKTDDAL